MHSSEVYHTRRLIAGYGFHSEIKKMTPKGSHLLHQRRMHGVHSLFGPAPKGLSKGSHVVPVSANAVVTNQAALQQAARSAHIELPIRADSPVTNTSALRTITNSKNDILKAIGKENYRKNRVL